MRMPSKLKMRSCLLALGLISALLALGEEAPSTNDLERVEKAGASLWKTLENWPFKEGEKVFELPQDRSAPLDFIVSQRPTLISVENRAQCQSYLELM